MDQIDELCSVEGEEERVELDPEDDVTGGIPQPDDDALDDRGFASRHTDLRLQTRLTSEGLQKRLFDIWYDAQTLEEEQGVNILYLALGLLRWFDADNSDIVRHEFSQVSSHSPSGNASNDIQSGFSTLEDRSAAQKIVQQLQKINLCNEASNKKHPISKSKTKESLS